MTHGGRSASIPHVSALDGARGLAVAGVLLFHGGHLQGGYLGVDFFFTLSGFLITSLLLAESSRTGSVGLGGFWARRARRLLPALAVLMVGVAVYAAVLAKPAERSQIRGDAFATLGYVANWHQIFSHTSYFALFTSPSPLNHTWSLAIEEQFYVVWPLVFVGLLAWWKRDAPKAVLVTALGSAVASSVLMVVSYDPANNNRVYFGTDTRAAAILFGVALAAALSIYGPVTKRNARIALEIAGLSGVVIVAVAWTRLDGQSSRLYQGGFLACGLAATAIIAAAVHAQPGPIARALSFGPFCALGLVSYGVYLYHWPIDVALNAQRAHVHGWPLFALQTAVTLTVAIASYKLIEQPVRRGALSSIQWRTLTPAVAAVLVVAVFAGTLGARAPSPVIRIGNPVLVAAQVRRAAPPNAERVMIAGDSVAAVLGSSFAAIHPDPPVASFDAGVAGCVLPPKIIAVIFDLPAGAVDQRYAGPCVPAWRKLALHQLRPQVVFWIANGPANQMLYDGRWIKPCAEPYDSIFETALRREVADLGVDGAEVVITTAAYPLQRFVGAEAGIDCENRLRREAARATGAQLVDLFAYICPRGHCRTEQNGVILRTDGVHYRGAGGEIVAQWLLDQVRAKS